MSAITALRKCRFNGLEQCKVRALMVPGLIITVPSAVGVVRRGLDDHEPLSWIHVDKLIEDPYGEVISLKIGNPPVIAVSPDLFRGHPTTGHQLRCIRRN